MAFTPIEITHLMTAPSGNICLIFHGKNLDVFPRQSRGKHLHSRETENIFPEGAVIKCFVIQHKQNKQQLLKQNNLLQE